MIQLRPRPGQSSRKYSVCNLSYQHQRKSLHLDEKREKNVLTSLQKLNGNMTEAKVLQAESEHDREGRGVSSVFPASQSKTSQKLEDENAKLRAMITQLELEKQLGDDIALRLFHAQEPSK